MLRIPKFQRGYKTKIKHVETRPFHSDFCTEKVTNIQNIQKRCTARGRMTRLQSAEQNIYSSASSLWY